MIEQTGNEALIDLAREADFRLGGLQVSPSTREVERDGQREALEPRVMQVLVALYRAKGAVVSRDDLIVRCWEGRIVGEDAINRAIWRLRKLAEADGDANFTIETIPRVGYRLMGGVPLAAAETGLAAVFPAVEAGETTVLPGPAISSLPHRRHWRLVAGMVLLAAGASAIAAWLLWPERHWAVESSRSFISTLALEHEPAFSPNGAMLAYTSGSDGEPSKIYVRNVSGGDPVKITSGADDDFSPSWSSDNTHLAYVIEKEGEPCRLMIATAPAGGSREAGRCRTAVYSSVAWQPARSFLYYADRTHLNDPGGRAVGIFRLDLDTGARLLITERATATLGGLRFSPDGKWLLYQWGAGFGITNIVIRDLASGKEKTLTGISQTGSAAWSGDSRTIFVSSMKGFGSTITAYSVDGAPSYAIFNATTSISHLAAGPDGLLALESEPNRKNLARASPTPIAQPDIIDPANGSTGSLTYAPDGTLAFVSNRSGTNAVWTMKPGSPPTLLYDAGLAGLSRMQYSPDGTRLALIVSTQPGVTVRILTASGASVASFHNSMVGSGLPTWTPDGKSVILTDAADFRPYRIAIDNPTQRNPVAAPFWFGITIRPEGTFAIRGAGPGIWRIDKGPQLLNAKYPAIFNPLIAFRGDSVLIPDFDAQGGPRILAQPLSGGSDKIVGYAPGATNQRANGFQSSFAANPKTGEIVYVAWVQRDSNIDLLTLTRR